jgi:hypothetical protein
MYFPNAFRKDFLPATANGSVSIENSGSTGDLTAGKIGFYKAKDFTVMTSGGVDPFIMAQGSYFTSDKIGPVHGGYKESLKSKVINPKYVSRVMKVLAKTPLNHVIKVEASACAGLACDSTFRLRLDIKGSPALRFLSHNLYRTLDAYTGCCDANNSAVDHTVALLKWADQINEYPLLKDFVQAKVYKSAFTGVAIDPTSGSATIVVANADRTKFTAGDKVEAAGIPANTLVVSVGAADSASSGNANVVLSKAATSSTNVNATVFDEVTTATYTAATSSLGDVNTHLQLATAYVDTTFGNCTFTPTDKYDLEPLFLYASVVEESGEPCVSSCISVSELQAPRQTTGVGETVLRDMILSGRYIQNVYPDSSRVESLRMREIEADPALATITRSALYDQVMILHNVPRFNNPTGTFDNDQYLLVIHVPTGTTTSSITNFVIAATDAAQGSGAIALETY